MVFISLGTQGQQFTRILEMVEKSNELKGEKIVAQVGHTKYESSRIEIFDFTDKDKMADYIKNANLVICHAGVGTIFDALYNYKKVIAVPRYAKYKEHVDDHQLEICEALEKEGYILSCKDEDNLDDIIKKIRKIELKKYEQNENYLEILKKEI